MPKLIDVSVNEIYALFKGEPGTRKSTAAVSFPTPQYWISRDQKMNSILIPARNFGMDMSQIDYDDYNDFNKIKSKLESFQVKCPYKTIIVDSITSVGDAINLQTLKMKSGSTKKDGGEAGHRIGGINVNTLEDYKAEAAAFTEMQALLKDIHIFHHVSVIMIAHVIGERPKEQAAGSSHFSRIIVTGGKAISAKIPAYCPEVYHFDVEPEVDTRKPPHYTFLTVPNGDDFARTALPLPNKITFDDKPLYSEYLVPAMKKLNESKPTAKSL